MPSSAQDATVGYLMWRVTTKWRAAVDRAVAPLGLTHAQYVLLASLYGLGLTGAQPSQRELADHTGLEPIYVSKLTRALESGGLLTRDVHPSDTRAVQLNLTEHGTTVVRQAVAIIRDLLEQLTEPIGGTKSQQHHELARTLRAMLGDLPGPNDGNGSDTMIQTPTLTGQDIGEAEGALRALLDTVLDGTSTSSTEYIALRVLALRGPWKSPAALHDYLAGQRQLHLDPPAVAELLTGLEDKGLISNSSPDGPVQATTRGAALHAELTEAVQTTTKRLYGGLDPNDLATAHRVLAQITERADRLRHEL